MLKDDGGIKALLEMVTSGSNDVIAQVARGMANFAKCESRGILQGLLHVFVDAIRVLTETTYIFLFTKVTLLHCCRTQERPFSANGGGSPYLVNQQFSYKFCINSAPY